MDYSRYTVGWICAIHKEYVAARAFLDKEHDAPKYLSVNDNNTYTLGEIDSHNVVISALPDGEYGIGAAARVATNLVRSFNNVKIGFMVSIGGGVPSLDHDIRLGDVVVSSPGGGKPGVFHYDFGKFMQNQGVQYTSCMNMPPVAVRTRITKIRSDYDMHGNDLELSINAALDKFPRLRRAYKRPTPGKDRLYQSQVVHDESCCQDLRKDDESRIVSRRLRTNDDDGPVVHFGLIASGNRVIKDATFRDAISKDHNVLCVEMEAAGLVSSFPCLVIRGICDYADSHKNDEWQGYAAMAAAAFAKDLLSRIPASKIEEGSDMTSPVDDNIRTISRIGKRKDLQKWLNAPDTFNNHDTTAARRMKNSGLWFINGERFENWKTQPNSFLLLCGIAVCGKTFLSSAIIDHLQEAVGSRLLYFYFDFRDTHKQTVENMLRSLIHQLAGGEDCAQKELDHFFDEHGTGSRQPSSKQLKKVFFNMLKQIDELWLVIDALDECGTRSFNQIESVLTWLEDLMTSQTTDLHVLATSRPDGNIDVNIPRWVGKEAVMSIRNDSASDDIRQYVQGMVRQDKWFERWHSHPNVQEEIESRLLERADGLFLLVACHLERLKDCLTYPMLQEALDCVPTTLCATYTQILSDIPPHFHANAVRILQLLTYSKRPLKIEEVVDAVAVNLDADPQFNSGDRIPVPEEILRFCPNLTIMVSRKHTLYPYGEFTELRLAHSSVKEYILSQDLHESFSPVLQCVFAETAIASVYVAYLLQFDHSNSKSEIEEHFPFAQYSAKYWQNHATDGNKSDDRLHHVAMKFFLHHKGQYFDRILLEGLLRMSCPLSP